MQHEKIGMRKLQFILCIFLMLTLCACGPVSSDNNLTTGPERGDTTTATKELTESETISQTEGKTSSLPDTESSEEIPMEQNKFYITAGNTTFTATFADNTSAVAFKKLLASGDVTVDMHDYGNFEKVGDLGHTLPRNDTSITTKPGDVILYQGNQITVYYDTNSWNFTRLGKIENVTKQELLSAFGAGNVSVTFSLARPE